MDGVRQFSVAGSTLNTSVTLAAGTHRFAVLAINTAGTKWETVVNATVGGGGGGSCTAPGSPGVNICKPVSGSTVSSPVQVQAAGTVTGTISHMELWVDGVKKFATTGGSTLNTSLSLTSGSHRFAVLVLNTAGTKWQQAINATVQ